MSLIPTYDHSSDGAVSQRGKWFTIGKRRSANLLKSGVFFLSTTILFSWSQGAVPLLDLSFDSVDIPDGVSFIGQPHHHIDGKVNRAVELAGSTGIATSVSINQLSSGSTWTAWVNPYQNISRKQLISIDDGGFDWTIGVEDGHWNVYSGGRRHITKLKATLDTWQFVFVQYDVLLDRIVVGVDESYEIIHHTINVPETSLNLGIGFNPGFGEYFQGAIDEVRIFDEVLDLSEIEAIAKKADPFRQIAHIEGNYRVLYARVSFPDTDIEYEGSKSDIEAVLSRVSSEVYQATYRKVTFLSEVADQTYEMPKGAAYYGGDANTPIRFKELTQDVRQALSVVHDLNSYDLVGVIMGRITEDEFPGTVWRYGGGDAGTFCDIDGCLPFNVLRSVNDVTVYHEFGHNLNLGHSSLWIPEDLNAPDGDGVKELYGYPFDIMGGRGNNLSSLPEFNHVFKYHQGWLEQNNVQIATGSGNYILRPFDEEDPLGIMSIIIPTGDGVSYHLGFRNGFPQSPETQYGIEIMRVENDDSGSPSIVDTSPGSDLGSLDSPLPIGKTFSFSTIPVHVTPLRRFRDQHGDAIEVSVRYENGPSQAQPQITLEVPTNATARDPFWLTANISYAGSDPLAVRWDLGRSRFIADSNLVSLKHTVITGGEQKIGLEVSDTRGSSNQDVALFTVDEPLEDNWQNAFLPQSQQRWMDVEYVNKRFIAVGDKIAVSNDGDNWTLFPHSVPQTHLESVTFGNGQYMAAGVHYNGNGFNGVIAQSIDGLSWNYEFFYDVAPLRSITFGINGFIAVGASGAALHSADGSTWSQVPIGDGDPSLSSVAYHDDYGYLAAGKPGTIFRSLDAIEWQAVPSGTDWYIDDIKVSKRGIHIAATAIIGLLDPKEATTWSNHYGEGRLGDIAIADDYLFCLRKNYQPGLWISDNGTSWGAVDCGFTGTPTGVAVHDGKIVISNLDGSILTHEYLLNLNSDSKTLTYSEWQLQYPWAVRGLSPAPQDDPDNDSIPNLAEYLMGTDPLRDDDAVALNPLALDLTEIEAGKVRLGYLRRNNIMGQEPILKQSSDLKNWADANAIEENSTYFFGDTENVDVTIESPFKEVFFKLEFPPQE